MTPHPCLQPRQGDALIFFPAFADGRFDDRMAHAGMPVKHGASCGMLAPHCCCCAAAVLLALLRFCCSALHAVASDSMSIGEERGLRRWRTCTVRGTRLRLLRAGWFCCTKLRLVWLPNGTAGRKWFCNTWAFGRPHMPAVTFTSEITSFPPLQAASGFATPGPASGQCPGPSPTCRCRTATTRALLPISG